MVHDDVKPDILIIKAATAIERLQEYRTVPTNTAVTGIDVRDKNKVADGASMVAGMTESGGVPT